MRYNSEIDENRIIKHVYGNVLRMAIPLTERRVTIQNGEVSYEDIDFVPSDEYPVKVEFGWNGQTIAMDVDMDGNIAYITDNGTLPIGTWSVTITCKDDEGNPYRFKQRAVVKVWDVTADAGIQQPIEFESQLWYLNGAIFLTFGGGGSGEEVDPSVPDYVKGITQEMIAAWNGKYTKPSGGIPKTDLAEAVQTSLGKADTALQEHQSLAGLATSTELQALSNALDALIGSDDVTEAIDTFNEVIAFLSGVTNNDGLVALLTSLQTAINAKYTKPNDGIPASDLAGSIPTSKITGLANVATSGSYNDLQDKPTIPAAQVQADWNESDTTKKSYIANKPTIPTIPTNVSSFTNDAGYLTSHQSLANYYTKSEVDGLIGVPIVEVQDTGDVSQTLAPNTFYKFTGALTSLTLTLTSGTGLVVYAGKFTSNSSTACTLSLPASVTEAPNNPTIDAGKTYEFNIVDNVLLMVEV